MEAIKADFLFLKKSQFSYYIGSELKGLEQIKEFI